MRPLHGNWCIFYLLIHCIIGSLYIYVELTFHYARYIAFLTTCHPQTLLKRNERNADCISLVLQGRRIAPVRTTFRPF